MQTDMQQQGQKFHMVTWWCTRHLQIFVLNLALMKCQAQMIQIPMTWEGNQRTVRGRQAQDSFLSLVRNTLVGPRKHCTIFHLYP